MASSAQPSPSPFAHGVASFDPLTDRVLLWTHLDPTRHVHSGVRWLVEDAADGSGRREGAAPVDPESGCVTVDVDGLQPASSYHYWFELDVPGEHPVLSPVGRTRTLPEKGCTWFRIGVACCADRSMGALPTYGALARDEVDLVLHLGDYIYEEPKGPFEVDPPTTCVTLDDYRRRHAHTRLDQDLQAMHLRHPVVFVWDDHDVSDNAWRHGAKGHDEEAHGPWEPRLQAAATARREWLPARTLDDGGLSMHRAFDLGGLAELVVLDTRIPGRDQQFGDEGAKALDDPDRALIDRAQWDWARDRIADRSRPWCLVASQVPVAELELPVPLGAEVDELMPSGYRVVDGEAVCTDLWEGYPAQRDALVNAFAARGAGSVVISGDVHSSWASLICDGEGEVVAVDLVCPAVSATEMGQQLPHGWRTAAEKVAADVPHQVWHDLERHGYLRVDVRPDQVRGDWFGCGTTGADLPERLASRAVDHQPSATLHPATPDAPPGSAAQVRRPGAPASTLPVGPVPERPASWPRRLLVGAAALGLVAAVAAVTTWVRRRPTS